MPFHGRSSERKIRVPEGSSNQYGRCPQNPSQLLTSLTRFNILGGVPTLPKRQLPVPRQHRGASLLIRIGFPPACVTSPAVLKLGQHRGIEGLAAGARKITPPTHSLTLILRYTHSLSLSPSVDSTPKFKQNHHRGLGYGATSSPCRAGTCR